MDVPPRVKLSNETFVFLDGKWVNETYIQSAITSYPETPQKHVGKKLRSDWTLWEENKALWEENQALRVENRALREENRALQCLRMENKGIQVIYDESLQQVLQQDKTLEGLPKLGLQNSLENKALQVLREENKALQVFRENNMALKIFPDKIFTEKKKPIPVLQKEKLTVQLLGTDEPAVPETSKAVTVQENNPKATLSQPVKIVQEIQEDSRSLPVLERNKTTVSPLEENEPLLAVQKLNQIMLSLLREKQALLEEKEAFQTRQGDNKILWEENNKLKLQQNAIKGAINKIAAQVDVLQQELSALAFLQEAENETKKLETC
ncbi:protein chibby homolog 2 [Eublepharis macularius]|uniref:Protein chibby homolog 2 n=1 Tax=Eublepharis macularius TaxID=481883 RepID=A0AA97L2E9_EUBMA|nr:protein chibby homolog 2 [Eublepharis macularius]